MAKPLPAPTPPPSDTPLVSEEVRRERVYRAISNHVAELTEAYVARAVARYQARLIEQGDEATQAPDGRLHLSRKFGREVLVGLTEIIFTAALKDGYFRFPEGYGSFRVQTLTANPKPKRLPTGEVIPMAPHRVKFKYEDGAAVRDQLGLAKKTNYKRRFQRESRLSIRTQGLLVENWELEPEAETDEE